MAQIIKMCYDGYQKMVEERTDPNVEEMFLMGSPLKVISITLLYYLFIKKIGPNFMSSRKPYNLRTVMLVYNLLQVIANGYLVYLTTLALLNLPGYKMSSGCHHLTKPYMSWIERKCFHMYFLLKVVDYMDTIFMVLRKNFRQITFLHVYHHILMVVACYAALRFAPVGQVVVMGYVNSAVHVVMYGYYFIAALKPGLRESIGWKKHITHLQLIQFFYLVIHFYRGLRSDECSDGHTVIFFCFIQSIVMIVLFSNFYIKTYIRKPKAKIAKN